jgi:hypothetical protein
LSKSKCGVNVGSSQRSPGEAVTAAAHPERTHAEHVEAAREIASRTYVEDLRRISPPANAALSRELEAEEMGL